MFIDCFVMLVIRLIVGFNEFLSCLPATLVCCAVWLEFAVLAVGFDVLLVLLVIVVCLLLCSVGLLRFCGCWMVHFYCLSYVLVVVVLFVFVLRLCYCFVFVFVGVLACI